MNQCVPGWDLDTPPPTTAPQLPFMYHTAASPLLPMSESDVAELTWEKGHLAMHGHRHHGIAKPIPKYPSSSSAAAIPETFVKTIGTLESVINGALPDSPLPWPSLPLHSIHYGSAAEVAAAADAMVPVRKKPRVAGEQHAPNCTSQGSTSPQERHESTLVTLDTWEVTAADDVGFTTASASPDEVGFTTTSSSPSPGEEGGAGSLDTENTSFGGRPLALDDQYYERHSQRNQQTRKRSVAAVREGEEEEEEKVSKEEEEEEEEEKVSKEEEEEALRSSISTKRSKASAVHNQSERKRRNRINERMKTLQKLVPNSSKTDKASMLNEVIEYLKQLQAQVQMMSRLSSISQMMMPMAMPQLQMSMMAQMAQMAQMGMGMGMMDLSPLTRHGHAGIPTFPRLSPLFPHVGDQQLAGAPALPDLFSTLSACPTQPMAIDAYNKMISSLYQHLYHQVPPSNLKN